MQNLFNGKYSIFILKKDIKDHPFLHEKGDTIHGDMRGGVTKENNVITMYDINGKNILYRGINHVDCIYKRFSIRTFLRIKMFERIDRRFKKFEEKYKQLKINGIKIKGTKKRIRVKPGSNHESTHIPYVKSLALNNIAINGDKLLIVHKYKFDGKGEVNYFESENYEIIDG
jgi:hypothetical protein